MWISISNPEARTLSFVDLSKVEAGESAVNELADLIFNDTNGDDRIIVYNKSLIS